MSVALETVGSLAALDIVGATRAALESAPMMEGPAALERVLSVAALAVGVVAAVILLLGVARGALSLVGGELRSGGGRNAALDEVRGAVGRYLLLGLELLVAADVMETILTPSIDHIAVLAGVVLIRTVIAFSLNWELERHHERERLGHEVGGDAP